MKHLLLLTAFGKDRPGIVARVTGVLFEGGGNIEDASMTRLGGEFVIMLVVGLPNAAGKARLLRALRTLGKKQRLTLDVKDISGPAVRAAKPSEPTHMISVYGADRPGIVHRVAQVLANRGVNISDLNTKRLKRSGNPFYVMLLEAQLPSRVNPDELRAQLQRLGRLLNVEVALREMEPVSL